jgi:protoporphyrinogen oxidase
MWTVPPERMTVDWMRDFIPKVDVARVVEGATSRLDSRVGLNAEFIYPTSGMSALGEALAAELLRPIRYKTSLRAISTQRHLAELSDGRFISYDALISTIPLPTLAGYADRLPDDVRSASARLQALDLVLVDVGAKQRRDGGVHWSYLPDNDVLPYRIHAGHNLSPELTPQGEAVYCAEISHSRARPLPKGSLKELVLEDLIQIGLVKSRADVTFLRERRFRNAYALPLAGSASAARHVRNHLARLEVFSVGRYGEWKYSNIEDALVDGPVAVARVLGGREQVASA